MLCGMNCSVSDLNFAKEKVFKDLKDNINRSLSALFRDIRKSNAALGLGDWPIMSMIVQGVTKFRNLNREEIKYMSENSLEYKDMRKKDKARFTDSLIESVNY